MEDFNLGQLFHGAMVIQLYLLVPLHASPNQIELGQLFHGAMVIQLYLLVPLHGRPN